MLEFFVSLAFFLLVLSAISAVVAFLLGYYLLVVAEHISGRAIISGKPRVVFSFVLGVPIAYIFSLTRQMGPFAFLLSFSIFLAVGVYSFLRVRHAGVSHTGKHGHLRKYDIADFEDEKPVRKFRLRERQKVPLKLIELDEEEKKRPVREPEKKPEKEGGLFGFLESIPNPLKSESPLERAAKEFVLTRFGEKGSVERTWDKGDKNFALVKSSGGRYTLTLNSDNTVVDWDKD